MGWIRPECLDSMKNGVITSGDWWELDAVEVWDLLEYVEYLEGWKRRAIETYSSLDDLKL